MNNPGKNKVPGMVADQERIVLLDIFRGFAILGIFVVNIEIMNCVFANQDEFAKQWRDSFPDRLSYRLLQLFFYTKFFPVFSFLFGLGISMQALKQMMDNTYSMSFFYRRMLVLLLIGIFHIVFLWSGDVLHIYAILGLLTSFFLKVNNRIILATSAMLLLFPFYEELFEMIFAGFDPQLFLNEYPSHEITRVLRHGSYLEGIRFRIVEYLSNIPLLIGFFVPLAFSMFLLGLYFGKQKIIFSLDQFVAKVKKPVVVLTLVTTLYRLIFIFILPDFEFYAKHRQVFLKMMFISDVFFGLFYLWLIAWIYHRYPRFKKMLSPLKYVGQMALTNYLMQSFIGLVLFSSIGFKLYEKLSPSTTLIVAFSVFFIQVIYSKVWLQYFHFGPMEWMWRCLSYVKLFPFKK